MDVEKIPLFFLSESDHRRLAKASIYAKKYKKKLGLTLEVSPALFSFWHNGNCGCLKLENESIAGIGGDKIIWMDGICTSNRCKATIIEGSGYLGVTRLLILWTDVVKDAVLESKLRSEKIECIKRARLG